MGEHPPADGEDAPLVVLVHGSMDRSAAFARCLRHLRDLHVVRYDRRGYGRSIGLGAPGVDGHADDLIAVLDGRAGSVVGHSIGGVIALVAAERAPDIVRSVGVFEAPMPWVDWWPPRSAGGDAMNVAGRDPADAAERFMRRMIGDGRWEALPAGSRADRRAEGAALVAELASVRGTEPAYDIDAIEVPVLVGRGSDSAAHHRRAADSLARLVGQDGGPFVIEGAGHGAHASHDVAFASFVRATVALARPAPAGSVAVDVGTGEPQPLGPARDRPRPRAD